MFLLSDVLIVCERRSSDPLPFEDICYLRGVQFVEGPGAFVCVSTCALANFVAKSRAST